MSDTYINESRKGWYNGKADKPDESQLKLGCLQRIANATEKMCLDREKLERDYRYMRTNRDLYRAEAHRLEKQRAALRGVVTRLKKERDQLRQQLQDQ